MNLTNNGSLLQNKCENVSTVVFLVSFDFLEDLLNHIRNISLDFKRMLQLEH